MKNYKKIILWGMVVLGSLGLITAFVLAQPKVPEKNMGNTGPDQSPEIPELPIQKVTPLNTKTESTLKEKLQTPAPTTQETEEVKENTSEPSKNTEYVTVVFGNERVNLSVAPGTVFYDALVEARNTGKLSFEGKKYPGLGFFVTDIGALHAGGSKDLLYYVNGKEATVGVSLYILKNGDVLEWKLE